MKTNDNDLIDFCNWFANFHGATNIKQSVIVTCLCGYFHTYTKNAEQLFKRCQKLNLVVITNDAVVINNKKQ